MIRVRGAILFCVCVCVCESERWIFFFERERKNTYERNKCFGSPGTIGCISTTSLLSSLSIDIFDAILCPVVARPVVLLLLISLFLVVNAAFRLFFEKSEKRKNVGLLISWN